MEYNKAIERYNNMEEWIKTANEEEQLKNYKHVLNVINNCNNLLNQIKAIDTLITDGEVLRGFK